MSYDSNGRKNVGLSLAVPVRSDSQVDLSFVVVGFEGLGYT